MNFLHNNSEFLQLIRNHEGYSSIVYDCPAGYPTLGYGRNLMRRDVEYQESCTLAEAEEWLREDIKMIEGDLNYHLPWWKDLPEKAQFALADMCFNLGITKLLGFSRTLWHLENHDFRKAAKEARDSLWYNQVGRRGVTVTEMIRECEYDK